MLAIDILSSNPENNEIKSLFEKIINGMNKTDKSMFCKSMIDLFDEKLVNDPERYANLNSMQNIIVLLSSMFNSSYEKLSQEELKLISTLLMNQIRIDSHLGITDNTSTDKFIEFLDNWGQITFNNQMDIMQQRIDAVLMGVQIKAFNTFKFDLIEDHLKEIKEQYKKMFDFSSDTNILKDNNIARLEGTLGQMYGFYYDIEQDDDYFELAEECLLDDIKATIDNTSSSEQAHGYLTSLYWKSGNLDKASEQFIKETNGEPKDKNKIFDLNDNKTFSTDEKPFIQLHRLYLCALAVKSDNQNIKGIEKEKEFLLKQDDLHQYPKLLSAKWLAIVYILQNDYQSANELLTKSLAIETNDDTIDVIKISSKILKHYVDLTLNQKTNFSCEEEIKRLANKQKEFKEVLFKRGAEKYYTNNIDDWNVYEIGGLLPFYFS